MQIQRALEPGKGRAGVRVRGRACVRVKEGLARARVLQLHAQPSSSIAVPLLKELVHWTPEVFRVRERKMPKQGQIGLPKYIVENENGQFITKENRTFDEIYGQMKTVNGDPTLARFGLDVNIYGKTKTVKHVNVAPNHIKIAKQF